MKPDDFESKIQQHPIRPMPLEWRGEILAMVNPRGAKPSLGERFKELLNGLVLRNRLAWSALGASWCVILILQTASSSSTRVGSLAQVSGPAPSIAIADQRRLLKEVLDNVAPVVADRPPSKPRRLRSQYGKELVFA